MSGGITLVFSVEEDRRGCDVYGEIARVFSKKGYAYSSMEMVPWLHHDGKMLYCRRLEVGAFQNESGTAVITGIRYRPLGRVDLKEAERMVETLAHLSDRLPTMKRKLGRRMTFGRYVAKVAEVIGVPTLTFPMPDGSLEVFPIAEGAAHLDQLVQNLKNNRQPVNA
jgi:hypothetical protein